jgi:hypothetical protein
MKDNVRNLKYDTHNKTDKNSRKVTWVVPSEILRAVEFVTGHDTPQTWEVATAETLQELSQFLKDISVVCEYMSEQLVFSGDKLTVYPKFEREGLDGIIIKEMIFYTKSKPESKEENTLVLQGEAIGKSLTDVTKVSLYKGFAHGFDRLRPVDSIIVSQHGSYRAVPQFEDLKWECTTTKSKKICSDTERGVNEKEVTCGDYFFGRTENYHDCPLVEVTGPVVFSSICGVDSEVLSSYYQDYKLSLWCNGYLSETLDMKSGVSTVSTKCEVRSEDGRTTYTHQTGLSVAKGATSTKLSSSSKNKILRIIEDVLGWPVTGVIIGVGSTVFIGTCICVIRCIGLNRCLRAMGIQGTRRSRNHRENDSARDIILRNLSGTSRDGVDNPPRAPKVNVTYNFAPDGRAQNNPRRLALA